MSKSKKVLARECLERAKLCIQPGSSMEIDAYGFINQALAALPRWISVGEGLPKFISKKKDWSEIVWVTDGRKVGLAWFVKESFNNPKDNHDYWASEFHTHKSYPDKITHWQPIALPEEEGK